MKFFTKKIVIFIIIFSILISANQISFSASEFKESENNARCATCFRYRSTLLSTSAKTYNQEIKNHPAHPTRTNMSGGSDMGFYFSQSRNQAFTPSVNIGGSYFSVSVSYNGSQNSSGVFYSAPQKAGYKYVQPFIYGTKYTQTYKEETISNATNRVVSSKTVTYGRVSDTYIKLKYSK